METHFSKGACARLTMAALFLGAVRNRCCAASIAFRNGARNSLMTTLEIGSTITGSSRPGEPPIKLLADHAIGLSSP